MRDAYHAELDDIAERVVRMTHLVAEAMQGATQALLHADLAQAEQVIDDDAHIDALRDDLEHRCFTLFAQQQPVAGDLRLLISTIHLASDLERMGDLAAHVAEIARRRHPEIAVPPPARDIITQMGAVASSLVGKVAEAVQGRDVALARAIDVEDDAMDALRRGLFSLVLSPDWSSGTEAAIDVTLLGRYYERYADHAVSVARRTVFVVTGQHPDRPTPVRHAAR
jgi:phosphate transport system protein